MGTLGQTFQRAEAEFVIAFKDGNIFLSKSLEFVKCEEFKGALWRPRWEESITTGRVFNICNGHVLKDSAHTAGSFLAMTGSPVPSVRTYSDKNWGALCAHNLLIILLGMFCACWHDVVGCNMQTLHSVWCFWCNLRVRKLNLLVQMFLW